MLRTSKTISLKKINKKSYGSVPGRLNAAFLKSHGERIQCMGISLIPSLLY